MSVKSVLSFSSLFSHKYFNKLLAYPIMPLRLPKLEVQCDRYTCILLGRESSYFMNPRWIRGRELKHARF